MAMMNQALANGWCEFSGTDQGSIARHHKCYIMMNGNTPLTGKSGQYSAATKFDEATRDRFQFVEIMLDEKFEMDVCNNRNWTLRVQKIRKAVKDIGGNVQNIIMCSMRASKQGACLLAAGDCQHETEESVIFKGAGDTVKNMVYAKVGKAKKTGSTIINFEVQA